MDTKDIGKLFMFGFMGKEAPKPILDFIKKDGLGGVILFRRNIESTEQLKKLTSDLQNAAGGELLIGIDQEGGRVANLPRSIIDVPPMERLGKDYENGECAKKAHWLGHDLGEKLRSLGINVDFAPVLDVQTNPGNPIIGNRSFSDNPETVSKLGLEVVRGLTQSHVVGCGKHFPGHGDTSDDSHHVLPRLPHDRKRLDEIELVPFISAIKNKIPSLMSAHVVYEGVDADNPATLSKKILTDLLRDELGFEGVLFSDDMEMRAIMNYHKAYEASVKAIQAGCDILLMCHTEVYQRDSIDAVKKAIDTGLISEERIKKSLDRIQSFKAIIEE